MTDHQRQRRANAMRDRAVSLNKKHRYDKSVEIYRQLIDQYSDLFDSSYLHFQIGYCYAHMFDWAQALPHLEKAYQDIPRDSEPLKWALTLDYLAITHLHLDNCREALARILEAEQYAHAYDAPDRQAQRFDHRLWVGRVLLYNQRFNEALDQLAKLEDLIPNDEDRSGYEARIQFETGRVHFYLENYQMSFSMLSEIDLNTLMKVDHPHFHLLMQRLYVEFKDYEKSLESFETLRTPCMPEDQAPLAYHFAGVARYHLGDIAEARWLFEKSAALAPTEDWLEGRNTAYLNALT